MMSVGFIPINCDRRNWGAPCSAWGGEALLGTDDRSIKVGCSLGEQGEKVRSGAVDSDGGRVAPIGGTQQLEPRSLITLPNC